MIRTLMQRKQELLDFEVEPETGHAHILEMYVSPDDEAVPLGVSLPRSDESLTQLIHQRSLAFTRPDKEAVLAAFGARSCVELSLMGHGLSLHDQFWYRHAHATEPWSDINFYDHDWDPAFGEAVLSGDYSNLAGCSPDVPETTVSGRLPKAWERDEEGTRLLKAPLRKDCADLAGTMLSSELHVSLLGPEEALPMTVVERYGRSFSASPLMTSRDKALVCGPQLLAMAGVERRPDAEGWLGEEVWDSLSGVCEAAGIEEASDHLAKWIACGVLVLYQDLHPGNLGFFLDLDTGKYHVAPIFDYDGAFGVLTKPSIMTLMCAYPRLAERMVLTRRFSWLDPSWDWSWFDPRVLEGFEERIVEAFAPYPELPPNFGTVVAHLFSMQRDHMVQIAQGLEGRS